MSDSVTSGKSIALKSSSKGCPVLLDKALEVYKGKGFDYHYEGKGYVFEEGKWVMYFHADDDKKCMERPDVYCTNVVKIPARMLDCALPLFYYPPDGKMGEPRLVLRSLIESAIRGSMEVYHGQEVGEI